MSGRRRQWGGPLPPPQSQLRVGDVTRVGEVGRLGPVARRHVPLRLLVQRRQPAGVHEAGRRGRTGRTWLVPGTGHRAQGTGYRARRQPAGVHEAGRRGRTRLVQGTGHRARGTGHRAQGTAATSGCTRGWPERMH